MNILQLTTHLNIGGITSYVVNITRALQERGNNVIISSGGGDMAAHEGITHFYLDIKTKSELSPKLWLALPKLFSLIKRENIDVIHAHTRVTQVLACALSRLTGVPYVATCHGFFKAHLARRIWGCWGRKTIAISDAVKNHLINDFRLAPEDIALIYTGVDTKRFKRRYREDEKAVFKKELGLTDKRVIGAIGRLSPVKGYSYLIEAFKILLAEYDDLRLLIVGEGPEEDRLKGICATLGLGDAVKFIKAHPDTPRLFSIMDIFVSSSVQEGLGLSLAEALAAGKTVVATDVGGISSLIKDGQTGRLAEAKNAEALARAVSGLLDDTPLCERLARDGRRLIEKDFTIGVMVNKIEEIYLQVTGGGDIHMGTLSFFKEAASQKRESVPTAHKILIINVNWVGDVLFTTPFIKAVRKLFPASYIACMVVPRCKEILDDNPNIDEVINYDEEGEHKGILGKAWLIMALRREHFDTAFILHRSFTRALLVFLSGIKSRIGYNTKNRKFFLTCALEEPLKPVHKVEYFLNIARHIGAETDDKDYEFFVEEDERRRVERFLAEKGVSARDILVVLNPGGNWLPKRWPYDKFAKLADNLSDKLNARIIITGAPRDSGLAKSIIEMSESKPINAAGSTSIKSLGALMERADLVISSDSGPMHLALGVKTKVIGLFGPTSDTLTGPYGSGGFTVLKKDVGCPVPCYNFDCRDYRCMDSISVDEVFEKAKEMLAGG